MKNTILNYFKDNYQPFFQKYLKELETLSGDEYRAICPFHEDTNPSFTFNNRTGKWYCHGCNKGGDIFHFYGKCYEINTKNDFRELLTGITEDFKIPRRERMSNIVKTYDYLSANGDLLFQVSYHAVDCHL